MIRKFIIVSLLTFNFAFYTPAAHAANSSPSADIQSKLKQLEQAIASKAAKLKQEVSNKLQNKAYVGNIQTKSTGSITLATKTGPKIVTLNQDTVYESKSLKVKSYSQKVLSEQDLIAALGDVDDAGVLTAKKIILLPSSNQQSKTFIWGQVVSLNEKLVTIKNREDKNIAATIDSDTVLKKGEEDLTLGGLKAGNFVIVSGVNNINDLLESSFIYVLPQGILLKPKTKLATPSATITPTKTASKSAVKK